MAWAYSNGGASTYTTADQREQHAAKVTIPVGAAVKTLYVKAAGLSGNNFARLVIWSVAGDVLRQSETFTMLDGSTSVQYDYSKSITPRILNKENYWVGLYCNPNGDHVMGAASSGNGYARVNNNAFPNVISMSNYVSFEREPYVGVEYVLAPAAISNFSVTRVSDTNQLLEWTNNDNPDQPYDSIQIQRYDNVVGSYYNLINLNTTIESCTDSTTQSNRQYRYRIRAINDAGACEWVYTDYINTTPAAPSDFLILKIAGGVSDQNKLFWTENGSNETGIDFQRKESADGISWGDWGDTIDTTLSPDVSTYTDTTPAAYNQYRVRTKTTPPALESDWVASGIIQVIQTPNDPSGLLPEDSYIDVEEANVFSWNHNAPDNTSQYKYSLRYRLQGDSWGATQYDEVESADEFFEIPALTFTSNEVYEWQVKTWSNATEVSDWSDIAVFNTSVKPVGSITSPSIDSTYDSPYLTLEWLYSDSDGENQAEYHVKLMDETDTYLLEELIGSSVVLSGNSDEITFSNIVERDTTYKVYLRVRDSGGLWSEWDSVEFYTDYIAPPKPTFSLVSDVDSGSVVITIDNAINGDIQDFGEGIFGKGYFGSMGSVNASYNKVYRKVDDGEYILIHDNVPVNTSVVDYYPTIGGVNYYYVVAVSDVPSKNSSDVSNISFENYFSYFLNSGNDFSEYVEFIDSVSLTENCGRETILKHYEGRTYPVKYQGNKLVYEFSFSGIVSRENKDALVALIEYVGDVLYRDYTGRYFYCAITEPSFAKIEKGRYYTFSCTITRMDGD